MLSLYHKTMAAASKISAVEQVVQQHRLKTNWRGSFEEGNFARDCGNRGGN